MRTVYLFDVDGTLAPSTQPMEPAFAAFFLEFARSNRVYLISGSDYPKLTRQVPLEILMACRGVFAASGAQYFEAENEIYRRSHDFSEELVRLCEEFVAESRYPDRTGNHVERRPGMLNVSVVGRKATDSQRKAYCDWDRQTGERQQLVDRINSLSLPYEAFAGGQISVDVVPEGWNKSVAKREVLERNPGAKIVFFGDRMTEGGNDKPLADALVHEGGAHEAIPVADYQETWDCLRKVISSEQGANGL